MTKKTAKNSENKAENKNVEIEQTFDNQKEYEKYVVPKMKELIALCDKYNLPHIISVQFSNDDKACGIGLICNKNGRKNSFTERMIVCGNALDNNGTIVYGSSAKKLAACLALASILA